MSPPPIIERVRRFLGDPGGDRFEELALAVFAHQYAHNPPYRRLCDRRNRTPDRVSSWRQAPAVPTEAFRHAVLATSPAARVFRTSGTTGGARGEHHLPDLDLYRASWRDPFLTHVLPEHRHMRVLSLVPSEEELPDSSLSFMVARILETVGEEGSGTYFGARGLDADGLCAALDRAVAEDVPVLLVGTAFAFVALLDGLVTGKRAFDLPTGSRVMDTGGFKGRARSVTREELLLLYRERLGIPPAYVVGEYGMTELSSQFYETRLVDFLTEDAPRESVYTAPPWMRWRVLDPDDLSPVGPGDRGLLAVYDLANAWTVSAVLTGDLVEGGERGFRLLGRAREEDLRGCSLTVEEILGVGVVIEADAGSVVRLREAARELGVLNDGDLLDLLAGALARFDDAERARLAEELARHTGSSAAMLRVGIDRAFAAHEPPALAAWLAAARREAGGTGSPRPRVVAQILAGNVGLLALPAVLESLLARSAVLLKPAAGDPVTPSRIREVLAAHDARLGAAVEVASWRGGDRETEAPLFAAVDGIVAAGGSGLARDLPGRVDRPLILRGPRVSIGLLGPEVALDAGVLDAAVRETVLWEQRGCLSPVVLLTAADPGQVARDLAPVFARYEERWPAAPREAGTARAIRGFRAGYETAEPKAGGLHADDSTAWTVVWDRVPGLEHGPAARVLRVAPLPEPGDLGKLLRSAAGQLQGVGDLGLDEARGRVLEGFPDLHRAPLDRIQDPPAGWRADGRSALAELLALEPANA